MNLAGKTALITGAGRGIGQGCALEFARAGANVVLNDRPGSSDIAATAEEIRTHGADCTTIEADVFSRAGCEALVAEALRAVERIDILISNPAFGVRCDFLDYDPADFEKVIAATLTGGFHVSQLVARHFVNRGGGKIVFISSVQAEMPLARCVAYGAAKAGLNHMARTMAVELAEARINVNSSNPAGSTRPANARHSMPKSFAPKARNFPGAGSARRARSARRPFFWHRKPPNTSPAPSSPWTVVFASRIFAHHS